MAHFCPEEKKAAHYYSGERVCAGCYQDALLQVEELRKALSKEHQLVYDKDQVLLATELQLDEWRPVVEAAKEVYNVRSQAVSFSQQGVTRSFEKYKIRHQEASEKLDAAVKALAEKRNHVASSGPPGVCDCGAPADGFPSHPPNCRSWRL